MARGLRCLITGTDVLAYLKALYFKSLQKGDVGRSEGMRDHFGNKKIAWWKDYYDLEPHGLDIVEMGAEERDEEHY